MSSGWYNLPSAADKMSDNRDRMSVGYNQMSVHKDSMPDYEWPVL